MPPDQEQTLNEAEVTEEGSSPAETTIPDTTASPSEGVKSVTGKSQEVSESVPYERFKEVEERAKRGERYESFLLKHFDKIKRNPVTGELSLITEAPKKIKEELEDLTPEDLRVFEELHPGLKAVLDKSLSLTEKRIWAAIQEEKQQQVAYSNQANFWFEKAKEEFGEDINNNNNSLRQRAMKILYEELAEKNEDGSYYLPPKAQYDAFAMAFIRLQKEAKMKSNAEKLPIKQQNKIVGTGGKGEMTRGISSKEFEKLPHEEQLALIREEFEKNLEAQ